MFRDKERRYRMAQPAYAMNTQEEETKGLTPFEIEQGGKQQTSSSAAPADKSLCQR